MRWVGIAAVAVIGCGRVGFDPICGLDGPCISAVKINGGALYAPGPRLSVGVTVTGDVPAVDVRVTAGPCNFSDDGWQPYDPAATYNVLVEPVDGVKQVCAWARDAQGGVSTVGTATIKYETANQPIVEAFDVIATDATHLRATWTVSDVEGLAVHPVDLEVMTAGTWEPLATGIGDGPTGTIDLPAPPGPYIVRLTVTDRAGNRGIRAMSDIIGAPGWSVYAGSPDRASGNAARSARLEHGDNTNAFFAVDPVTLDVYVFDNSTGILRIDGATGLTEKLIGNGNTNLPDDGPLPPDATVQFNPSIHVGPDGMLYVSAGTATPDLNSAVIYQIDPKTRHVRRYIGGGIGNDATATPASVFVSKWIWTFDEDGSLYFLTSCTPGSVPNPVRMRLMKATRQPDGTAGVLTVVAGNCATGSPPPGPVDATTVPLGVFTVFAGIGTIAAYDHGRVIYLGAYSRVARKVVDGQAFATDLPVDTTGELAYDQRTGTIVVAAGSVTAYTPNLTGTTETFAGVVAAETGTGACVDDGVPASDACVHVGFTMQSTADRLYMADGLGLNEQRTFRVRFADRDGLLRTYVGAKPVNGDGLPRRLVRAQFAGIAYKPASAPNQGAFPAGLYFVDPMGIVLGRVDEATGQASLLWGNQSGASRTYVTGDPLTTESSLGRAYGAGTLESLGVDGQGLPIIRYGRKEGVAHLLTADASGRALVLQTGSTNWEVAADGTDPETLDLWPYGALSNISIAGSTVFVLGGYRATSPTATLRAFDFAAHSTRRLMGSGADGFSADTANPANASFSGSCHDNSNNCFTYYRSADDRLYFSEDNRLRYITTPQTPATSALVTLFTLPNGQRVSNFTIRPDGSQVFYQNNGICCHDISSGQAYCNDTPLGPPALLGALSRGPDQFTWKDNNTLLFSTYTGYVLQYTLP